MKVLTFLCSKVNSLAGWGNRNLCTRQVLNHESRKNNAFVHLLTVAVLASAFLHAFIGRSFANSRVISWGSLTNVPPNLTNAVAITAGQSHSLALRADGTVVAWGDNSFGQTNTPPGLINVVAIAAGGNHNLAEC